MNGYENALLTAGFSIPIPDVDRISPDAQLIRRKAHLPHRAGGSSVESMDRPLLTGRRDECFRNINLIRIERIGIVGFHGKTRFELVIASDRIRILPDRRYD